MHEALKQTTPARLESATVHANKRVEVYIGKWINVIGAVANVREYDFSKTLSVTLSRESLKEATVRLIFESDWHDQVSLLRQGNAVSVTGKIENVDWPEVLLRECELTATPPIAVQYGNSVAKYFCPKIKMSHYPGMGLRRRAASINSAAIEIASRERIACCSFLALSRYR